MSEQYPFLQHSQLEAIGYESGLGCYQESNTDSATLLIDGEFYDDLLAKIHHAQTSICIVQYLFTGTMAQRFLDALVAAHERGVQVFLMIDRQGSGLVFLFSKFAQRIRTALFSTGLFRSGEIIHRLLHINSRIHSKVAYIDGQYSWLGSHNIRDEGTPKNHTGASNITLRLEGAVTEQVAHYCECLWQAITGKEITIPRSSDTQAHTCACVFACSPCFP